MSVDHTSAEHHGENRSSERTALSVTVFLQQALWTASSQFFNSIRQASTHTSLSWKGAHLRGMTVSSQLLGYKGDISKGRSHEGWATLGWEAINLWAISLCSYCWVGQVAGFSLHLGCIFPGESHIGLSLIKHLSNTTHDCRGGSRLEQAIGKSRIWRHGGCIKVIAQSVSIFPLRQKSGSSHSTPTKVLLGPCWITYGFIPWLRDLTEKAPGV